MNVTWGYDRIQGALANSGHIVAPNTVKKILKRHGIEPAPEREKRTLWRTFRRALIEYVAYYHSERNHQGVGNRLLQPVATLTSTDEPIQCRERLGGMLNFCYREAA